MKFKFYFIILSFACEIILIVCFIVFDLNEFMLIYNLKLQFWVINVTNRQEIVTHGVVTTRERSLEKAIKKI